MSTSGKTKSSLLVFFGSVEGNAGTGGGGRLGGAICAVLPGIARMWP